MNVATITPTYMIGDCTLYHADARAVLASLASGSVDMVCTDPPYGHRNNDGGDLISCWERALGTGQHDAARDRPIANDGAEANDLFRELLPVFARLLKPGCCVCCCCGGGGPDPQFARWSLWLDEVLDFKQMVVWDKGPIGMGWHYRRSYETVLVAQKPGAACKWYDDTSRIENIIRPNYRGIRKIIPQADEHPTAKPVELMEHFIRLHTAPGDLVLDPFVGGGATAVACVRTGRRFVGCDVDAAFVEMTASRVREAVGVGTLFAPELPEQGYMFDESET